MADKHMKCAICGGGMRKAIRAVADVRLGVPGTWDVVKCPNCGLEATEGAPDARGMAALYRKHYNRVENSGGRYAGLRQALYGSFLYRLLMVLDGDVAFHHKHGAGRLLDVGCNEGRGMEIFRRNGFMPEGLEINRNAAGIARRKGFYVYGDWGGIGRRAGRKSGKYGVVVLTNVLEHTPDPEETLRRAARAIERGGELWLSVPNGRSWLRALFGRKWVNWHVPFHLFHFNERTLRRLLKRVGFRDIQIMNQTPALWAAQSVIAALFGRSGKATRQLRNPVLVGGLMLAARSLFFPFLWLGNILGRGDALVVEARAVTSRLAGTGME